MNHTLALIRESGRIELYLNFMLTEQYSDPRHKCINVQAINNGYVFTFQGGDSTFDKWVAVNEFSMNFAQFSKEP